MHPASVGFQCSSCVSAGRETVRPARTLFGAAIKPGGGPGTKAVMGAVAGVYVLDLISLGVVGSLTVLVNQAVAAGQFWRLLTYGFSGGSLFGVLLNLLVLWLVGRALESELGLWRFLALYVAGGLGGATLSFVLGPPTLIAWGSSAAVIALLAANAIGKLRSHEDIRGDISLLVLLILYSVLVGYRNFGWLGMMGSAAVGALVGLILAYAPRQNKTAVQIVGILGVMLLCLVAVVGKMVIG
jgi:membrane associated rhomboid family serine protease